jgi:hypothetical protein
MPKLEEMTQEDVDRMQSALDDFKKENQKFREQRDEFKKAAEGNEVNAKLKERALRAEAKLKVSELGVKDPERIVKYLKLDTVDFDEEDNVTGLDDSIESVKADFPELFDAKRRVGGKIDAAAANPVKAQKSVTEAQVDRLFSKK